MEQPEIMQTQPTIVEKVYKTPTYIRKAVKTYTDKKKTEDLDIYKQKRSEANKKYYQKFKKIDSCENNF